MPRWTRIEGLISMELEQRKAEGCDVSGYAEKIKAAGQDKEKLCALYSEIITLPVAEDFPYKEPSAWEEINKLCSEPTAAVKKDFSEKEWMDKFLGAWLGRCSGCALGIPFETEPYEVGTEGVPGWKNVMRWYQGAGEWPIAGYAPGESEAERKYGLRLLDNPYSVDCKRENIRFMTTDDDIRYVVLALMLLEKKGFGFSSQDVGENWHKNLTYGQVHTAEGQAYLNYGQAMIEYSGKEEDFWKEKGDWVRSWMNPFREWIGAQIRVDGYAYAAAGNPHLAAKLAWKDASFSHDKNALYASMFIAAMIAAAFVADDVREIVETGLSEIPATSRLAEDIKKAIQIAETSSTQEELVERIWNAFCHYHCIHANNNAAIVTAAILFSKGNFEKGITTAVLGGWDTDCNGATVGSVLGALNGAKNLPHKWTEPLHDILYTGIGEFPETTISDCAKRSYDVFVKNRKAE